MKNKKLNTLIYLVANNKWILAYKMLEIVRCFQDLGQFFHWWGLTFNVFYTFLQLFFKYLFPSDAWLQLLL